VHSSNHFVMLSATAPLPGVLYFPVVESDKTQHPEHLLCCRNAHSYLQMVRRDQDKRPPTHKLLEAISRVLDLSTQFPDLALDPLLKPIIAAARTRYGLDALLPKVKSMRRILPDTMLRAELLRRGVFCTACGYCLSTPVFGCSSRGVAATGTPIVCIAMITTWIYRLAVPGPHIHGCCCIYRSM
jgi:hypothetical protein